MIIGPFGFNLIRSVDQIDVMAEIGVMLLMFTIGLEVSYTHLFKIKNFSCCRWFATYSHYSFQHNIFCFLGIELKQAIFFSMLVSLSSTAIVLRIFSDSGEIDSPHGKIALSILIFQDLAIVPMFLLLPLLGSQTGLTVKEIFIKLFIAFGSMAIIMVIAKLFMPRVIHQIARLRMREAFTIGIILLLLGTAYLTHSLGLSFALGAFIAGLILAESDYNHQIVAEITPFKDAFNSIFFVSIGLLLNIQFVIHNPLQITLLTVGILIFKTSIIVLIVLFLKYPLRVAVLAGLALSQVGEFSFILAQAGSNFKLISSDFYNAFLGSTIFTMILTPLLIKFSPYIASKTSKLERKETQTIDNLKNLAGHVIIAGFGLNGSNLARVLKETAIRYVVIELNPDTVKKEKAKR